MHEDYRHYTCRQGTGIAMHVLGDLYREKKKTRWAKCMDGMKEQQGWKDRRRTTQNRVMYDAGPISKFLK